jgi:hypothetical protein
MQQPNQRGTYLLLLRHAQIDWDQICFYHLLRVAYVRLSLYTKKHLLFIHLQFQVPECRSLFVVLFP